MAKVICMLCNYDPMGNICCESHRSLISHSDNFQFKELSLEKLFTPLFNNMRFGVRETYIDIVHVSHYLLHGDLFCFTFYGQLRIADTCFFPKNRALSLSKEEEDDNIEDQIKDVLYKLSDLQHKHEKQVFI